MTPFALERGQRPRGSPNFGAVRVTAANRKPLLSGKRMERLWKNEGATRRKRFDRFKPRNRLDKPNLVATGCHRLPPKSHGKEGVDGSSPSEGSGKARKARLLLSGA